MANYILVGITTAIICCVLFFMYNRAQHEENIESSKVPEKKIKEVTYLKDNKTGLITRIDKNTPRINIENCDVTIHNIVIDTTGNKELKKLALDEDELLDTDDEYLRMVCEQYEKLSNKYSLKS